MSSRFLSDERLEEVKKVLVGLNYKQWCMVQQAVDRYYSKRVSEIVIEDSKMLDNLLNECLDRN